MKLSGQCAENWLESLFVQVYLYFPAFYHNKMPVNFFNVSKMLNRIQVNTNKMFQINASKSFIGFKPGLDSVSILLTAPIIHHQRPGIR